MQVAEYLPTLEWDRRAEQSSSNERSDALGARVKLMRLDWNQLWPKSCCSWLSSRNH
jgi:hypothetical protein